MGTFTTFLVRYLSGAIKRTAACLALLVSMVLVSQSGQAATGDVPSVYCSSGWLYFSVEGYNNLTSVDIALTTSGGQSDGYVTYENGKFAVVNATTSPYQYRVQLDALDANSIAGGGITGASFSYKVNGNTILKPDQPIGAAPVVKPTAFNVNGNMVCQQKTGSSTIYLDGSEVGVTYTLYKDNVAQTNAVTVATAGQAVAFNVNKPGVYTIRGANAGGTTTMTGNSIIVSNIIDINSTSGCLNNIDVSFTSNGALAFANGAGLKLLGYSTALTQDPSAIEALMTTEGTYTIGLFSPNGTQCASWTYVVSGNKTITLVAGECGQFKLENPTSGVTYSVSPAASVVSSTAAAIVYKATASGTYTITDPNCGSVGSVSIVMPNGKETLDKNGVTECATAGNIVTLDNLQIGVTYSMYRDGVLVEKKGPVSSATTPFQWVADQAGEYTFKAVSGNCSLDLPFVYTVNVTPTTAYAVSSVCNGASNSVQVANSEAGVTYYLYKSGSATAVAIRVGTGGAISFPGITASGTYTVVAKCEVDEAGIPMTGSVVIPEMYQMSTGSSCAGNNITISLLSSQIGVAYQIYRDGVAVGGTRNGTGGQLDFTVNSAAAAS